MRTSRTHFHIGLCTLWFITLIDWPVPIFSAASSVVVDPEKVGPEFDGHGGLSAGASSRLLMEYQKPYRGEILDYLFLPGFGASLGVLKIEIGGDAQSTVGTEPSHMHSRGEVDCGAGYEGWLAREARKRNPDISIWALSWGVPGWIGDYHSAANIDYQIAWLECLRDYYEVTPNLLGLWNEEPQGSVDYVLALRKELNKRGFEDVGITVEATWQPLINNVLTNPEFNRSITAATLHYPCDASCDPAIQAHKKLWVGEDSPTPFQNWTAASCWGRKLNQHYLKLQATSVTSWALVWSALAGISGPPHGETHQFGGNAFLTADEPWSGHYKVPPTVWVNAHWGQFVFPGWKFLAAGHGSGFLPLGGSYVTLVSNKNKIEFTMIIETLQGSCGEKCNVPRFSETQRTTFHLDGRLATTKELSSWCSNNTEAFVKQPTIEVQHGSFTVDISPDTICTITSQHSRGSKGLYPEPPLSRPFPRHLFFPLTRGHEGGLPPLFSDVYGSFAVHNQSLVQVATSRPIGWAAQNLDPLTLIGDPNWEAVEVKAKATFLQRSLDNEYIRVCGGCANTGYKRIRFSCPDQCCVQLGWRGDWFVGPKYNGTLNDFVASDWHAISVDISGPSVEVKLNGNTVLQHTNGVCPGMVGLGCGSYHRCAFQNIYVDAPSEKQNHGHSTTVAKM